MLGRVLLGLTNTKQKIKCLAQGHNTMSLVRPGLEVIKLEYILNLKIKRNDWLLADTCLQAANHCTLF